MGNKRLKEGEQVDCLIKLSNFISWQWLIKTSKQEDRTGPKASSSPSPPSHCSFGSWFMKQQVVGVLIRTDNWLGFPKTEGV